MGNKYVCTCFVKWEVFDLIVYISRESIFFKHFFILFLAMFGHSSFHLFNEKVWANYG